jgi:hypothetical protein
MQEGIFEREDDWSFSTSKDAVFESFDDLSILTEDNFDEEKDYNLDQGTFKVELALNDFVLMDFLFNYGKSQHYHSTLSLRPKRVW